MSNWRRQKPRNNNNNNNNCYHQRGPTITQSSTKPPLANGKHSVPAWEKDFCAVIGSVPWWKVVEAKRFMHIYDRVVQWDDSAGEDAFKNAKSRFWAEINGFACDLSLPDPDVYIDDVNWDAEVDTELILDLERGPDPVTEEQEPVVIFDALVLSGQNSGLVWGTGWGEAEGINEDNFGTGKPENSWDDQKCDGWNEDSWGRKEKTESWGHKNNTNSFNTESWDHKNNNNSFNTESWDHKKNNSSSFKTESWGHKNNNNSFNTESWDHKNNNNSFNTESWDHKKNNSSSFKTEFWDQKNNNNSFKTESWDHKNINNNSFNHRKVENWNGRDQGRESRGWRKRGEVQRGGDGVEDCRWRNGRGRSRGGFQQNAGWTESF